MEWFLIGLTLPVFYIIGLITFVRWLSHRFGHAPAAAPDQYLLAAAELQARARTHEGKVKQELLAVADSLLQSAGALVTDTDAATIRYEPGQAAPTHQHAPAPHSASHRADDPTAAGKHWTQYDLSTALASMDNVNLLLFLGAFLVVVSAGIFVGYNFNTLSGGFKTSFLFIFAALFYGLGIVLYRSYPKLRPAGNTFTGIGLILLPLVGLAAYNFTSLHQFGHAVWFATSLVTLLAYLGTLWVTRQTYVAYLMAFTSLSLFESSISLFNAPVYWFGWGMGLVALALLVISRWTGWWREAAGALQLSGNLFIPISLLFSLGQLADHGLSQFGITVAIAGMFYAYLASRDLEGQAGKWYWSLALVAVPLALATGLWDAVSQTSVAWIWMGVAALYAALGFVARSKISPPWQQLLAVIAGLLPFAAIFFTLDEAWGILIGLLVATAVNGLTATRLREPALALLGELALLFVPAVLLRQVMTPAFDWWAVALNYLALAPVLYFWRQAMQGWRAPALPVGRAGYLLALLLALLAAAAQGHVTVLLVGGAIAAGLFWLSYLEFEPSFIYLSSLAKYIALVQIVPITHWPDSVYAVVVIVVGGLSYLAGYALEDAPRGQALRYSAIGATLMAACLISFSHSLPPIASLALGGALLWAEARRQGQPVVEEVGVAVLIVALNWLCGFYDLSNSQLYTLPWAGFIAWLAYRRRHLGHETYDTLVGLALAALTLPIAGQALAEDGAIYGLELIFIAVGLVFLGISMRYKLVSWWGAGTLIVEVLYQMRDFLTNLPMWLVVALLGLGLLAAAIVLLQRRNDH